MSVVANDQYASLKLAEKRKKRQLTENQNTTKSEIQAKWGLVFLYLILSREGKLAPRPYCNKHFKY